MAITEFAAFFLAALVFANAKVERSNFTGSYLIVAPRTIRPSLPYSVSVNIFDNSPPIVVDMSILDDQNRSIAHAQGLSGRDFKAGQAQTVSFDTLPTILTPESRYRLRVMGKHATSGKALFDQQQDLAVEQKSRSVFVQTDKAIYKPGSLVHFRVVVVTPDLKPYKGKADIKINDPNENLIKQYLNQTLEGGVLGKNDKLSLQLSEEPPLGDWKISVDVEGQKTTKSFTVDKYVLPKFDASVQPPPYVSLTDDVEVNVTAKYTYGKGVVGKVTVEISVPYYYFPQPPWSPDQINRPPPVSPSHSKTIDLDKSGVTTVRFAHDELIERKLIPDKSESYYLEIKASVTEKFSGTQKNVSSGVTAYKNIYRVQTQKQVDQFKPGLDFNITISVVTQDGKPLPATADKTIFVTIAYAVPFVPTTPSPVTTTLGPNVTTTAVPDYHYHIWGSPPTEDITENRKLTLGSDGTYVLSLNPPLNASRLRVEVRYSKNTTDISGSEYAEASKSPTNSFLQLLAKTESVKAGQTISFKVRTTANVASITAQVISKGYIALSKQVKLAGQSGEISFPTTSDMSPQSRIIAYAIRPDNKEILVDAMDFRVEGLFKNNVSISVKPGRVEPNQTVTFTVKGAPSSYVGLLAVDQSVLLLRSGNDITSGDIESDIAGYSSGGYYHPWIPFQRRRKRSSWCRWCWWVGGQDAASVFDNSGVVVFTDAYLYRQPPPPIGEFGPVAARPIVPPDAVASGEANAAPAPASKGGEGGGRASEPETRKNFPETWIWADAVCKANGVVTYEATAPDTITSWITSAFAISDDAGLGVAPEPAKVTVTLEHNATSGFDFVEKPGLVKEKQSPKQWNVRLVTVPGSGGSAVTYFPIVPTIVGELKLLVKAIGETGSDAVEMPLIVEPEGFPVYKTSPLVLELTKGTNRLSKSVQLEIPKDAVAGSQKAEFTVNGDVMAPVLNNIDQLVQMPYGCGEQNMLTFVPDIVVTQYLKTTQRLTSALEARAKRYMESGYQRELTYQRDDASYSAFGKSDGVGSTWLTAFVTRAFKQAKQFIFVDDAKLKAGINFLRSQQKENGVFEEHGMVHHKAMQGGASQGGLALTAYVLLSFLENDEPNLNALNYLERSLDRIGNDSYALAIVSYALHLAKSSKKDDAWKLLQKQAVETAGLRHWQYTVRDDLEAKEPSWWESPRPVDVEATSYALLSYVLRDSTADALPIVRWLASKRNAYGGFSSTQDTVVALQALSAYASRVYSKDTDVSVTVTNGATKGTFKIDPTNAIVLQSNILKELDKPIAIEASGKGIAYAQVNYHYNMPKRNDPQPFVCTKDVGQKYFGDVRVSLCCKYALTGHSNMVVVEANALSGYTIDEYELNRLTSISGLQRVELVNGGSKANIYITSLNSTALCFNISADRSFQVADQKPALIIVYDYYDPGRRIEFDYSLTKQQNLLEVCGDDCWPGSGVASDGSAVAAAAGNSSATTPAPPPKAQPTTPVAKKATSG